MPNEPIFQWFSPKVCVPYLKRVLFPLRLMLQFLRQALDMMHSREKKNEPIKTKENIKSLTWQKNDGVVMFANQ